MTSLQIYKALDLPLTNRTNQLTAEYARLLLPCHDTTDETLIHNEHQLLKVGIQFYPGNRPFAIHRPTKSATRAGLSAISLTNQYTGFLGS